MRFSPASRLQGSASLLIKQKSAAQSNMQSNMEKTSGWLADATNWDIAFRNRPNALLPKFVIHRSDF
jgi:hypothetical protein